MSDRMEFCTPEERRFLDIMHTMDVRGVHGEVSDAFLSFEALTNKTVTGHQLVKALYAARGDRD